MIILIDQIISIFDDPVEVGAASFALLGYHIVCVPDDFVEHVTAVKGWCLAVSLFKSAVRGATSELNAMRCCSLLLA